MDLLALFLSIASAVGVAVLLTLWRSLPAYATEKAKNLASKEDLAHLTELVESVKATHSAEIERLKANLAVEAQATERRRRLYEAVADNLRVFVEGHDKSDTSKQSFQTTYAATWLWASDDVVNELNHFIELKKLETATPTPELQGAVKAAYVSVVLAMRRDAGFPATAVRAEQYQFFKFV